MSGLGREWNTFLNHYAAQNLTMQITLVVARTLETLNSYVNPKIARDSTCQSMCGLLRRMSPLHSLWPQHSESCLLPCANKHGAVLHSDMNCNVQGSNVLPPATCWHGAFKVLRVDTCPKAQGTHQNLPSVSAWMPPSATTCSMIHIALRLAVTSVEHDARMAIHALAADGPACTSLMTRRPKTRI
eukprot:3816165-Amphidinium_carterae.2